MSSRLGLAAALVCATALIAGCAPSAEPTPTKTAAFASEDEAFAAAEKTYRAYVDALNNVDLSDPATFEDVYKWETGDAENADKKNLTKYHAEGNTIEGASVVQLLKGSDTEPDFSSLTLYGCLDVSTVVLRDGEGNSLVSTDRRPVQSVKIGLTRAPESPTGLLVDKIAGRSDGPSC